MASRRVLVGLKPGPYGKRMLVRVVLAARPLDRKGGAFPLNPVRTAKSPNKYCTISDLDAGQVPGLRGEARNRATSQERERATMGERAFRALGALDLSGRVGLGVRTPKSSRKRSHVAPLGAGQVVSHRGGARRHRDEHKAGRRA